MFAFLGGSVAIKIRNHYQEFRSWQLSSLLLAISLKNNNNQKNKQTSKQQRQQLLKLENFPSAILRREQPA